MRELPFQEARTDALVELLRRTTAECNVDEPDMLPSIDWCEFNAGPRAGTWDWSLHFFSRKFMRADDIFTVGDISVHIAANERGRLSGRVLDWVEGDGLIHVL